MRFQKDLLLIRLVIGLVFLNIDISDVNAMTFHEELPLVQTTTGYDFKNDPFLLEWTFRTEDIKAVAEPAPQSKEDKLLAHWKEKQARLWTALPEGQFTINASAYTAAADECGKSDGITASGIKVAEKRTLACPPNFPFGTKIAIEGLGEYRCEDRGGAIKGNHIDIYMQTKKEAFSFGRRNLIAQVVK
jgi:3D (Asp-Asp-Asp) domain-containing protein